MGAYDIEMKNYILPFSVSEFKPLMEFRDGGIIKEVKEQLKIFHFLQPV